MNKESATIIFEGIDRACQEFHSASFKAGWWDTNVPLSFLIPTKICLIHSEISEAMEGFRKNEMDSHIPSRSSIEVELADALIRIFDLAGKLKLDLAGAVLEKGEFNKLREDHKLENRAKEGGKKF